MKKVAFLVALAIALASMTGYTVYPAKMTEFQDIAQQGGNKVWDKVEQYQGHLISGVIGSLLILVVCLLRGKSLRESVETAATRVLVVNNPASMPAPAPTPEPEVSDLQRKIKARGDRTHLLEMKSEIERQAAELSPAIKAADTKVTKAQKEVAYAENAVTEAEDALAKKKNLLAARSKDLEGENAALAALIKKKEAVDAEHSTIAVELKKYDWVV